MSNTIKRNMSAQGFLKKTISKAAASAQGFLAAHREYLLTGEVSEKTAPIVARFDAKELLPTPALIEIQKAVQDHIFEQAKASIEVASEGVESRTTKPFTAAIFDINGNICLDDDGKEIRGAFDLPQRAKDWCIRRLFEGAPGTSGETFHHGAPYESVKRDDAFAVMLKGAAGAVCKTMGKSSGKLSFGVKAKQDFAKFSRG